MVLSEEEKFLKTLTSGEEILRTMMEGKKCLTGEEVFKLYDTYGFPSDLTKEIALEGGVSVDMEGFEKCMEEQRERARNARGEIESFHKQSKDLMAFKTPSEFLYDQDSVEATVTGLFVDGVAVKSIDEKGEVILDKTPFYAEMGGQVSDTGTMKNASFEAEVTAVSVATNTQHLHAIEVKFGTLKVGDKVTLSIDASRRRLIERNHSATHLLHKALCDVLKSHVDQKGSYVDENYLRFDFSASRKLSAEELQEIEEEVNGKIAEAIPEVTEVLPIEEAKKRGAEMEFSEKYGSEVRVVEFGEYSREFCGGTHVKNSSDIGVFALVEEGAIASGVRRLVGVTSLGAYRHLANRSHLLNEGEALLGAGDVDVLSHIKNALAAKDEAEKEAAHEKAKLAEIEAKSLSSNAHKIGTIAVSALVKEGASRQDLLTLGDSLKAKSADYAIILLGGVEGARPLVVFLGGAALKKAKAGDLIKELGHTLNGSGGGKPEMASGQVKTSKGFEDAVKSLEGKLA
jgi:alanyl-tRNA synthetase